MAILHMCTKGSLKMSCAKNLTCLITPCGLMLVLAAAMDRFEIWDAGKYKQLFEDFSPEDFSRLAEEVMKGTDTQKDS